MENNAILEMLIEQKELIKSMGKNITTQTPPSQLDIEEVKQLTKQMQTSITKMDEVLDQARQPVIKQHKFTVDIMSRGTVFIFVMMIIIISALSAGLYLAQQPNYDRIDNDLKYRYIKMKGEASPARIIELEDLFESNRDNAKIRQMLEDVEAFEEAVQKKVLLDEQNRLRTIESEKLNQKVKRFREE